VTLIAAGLFLRSLGAANRIDPGYDPEGLAAVSIDVGFAGLDPARGALAIRALEERLRALPGVKAVSFAAAGPMEGSFARSVFLEGQETSQRNGTLVQVNAVSADYFPTIGIPVLAGRAFTSADREGGAPVAIVNETMAKAFWPGARAIGHRFRFFGDDRPVEVVGVAKDAKYNALGEDPQPYLYVPHAQRYSSAVALLVRASGHPNALLGTIRREVAAFNRDIPITKLDTGRNLVASSLWAPEAGAFLLGIFGLVALVLAAIGIYGVMSFAVSQRRREIGIRMALGAEAKDVLSMVLKQGMFVVALGLGVGLGLALFLSGFTKSLLYGIPPIDPVAFAGTSVLLAMVALLAGLVPARRASAVDPSSVLRID